jgi:hypothetical protein
MTSRDRRNVAHVLRGLGVTRVRVRRSGHPRLRESPTKMALHWSARNCLRLKKKCLFL